MSGFRYLFQVLLVIDGAMGTENECFKDILILVKAKKKPFQLNEMAFKIVGFLHLFRV
jgi:hypothetical protein